MRSPKVYLADSGLLHAHLDVVTREALERHPSLGASWEGFCLEQIVHHLGARADQCYFWATQAGAELDLLVVARGTRRGFEIKRTDAPKLTPSMKSALTDLSLDSLHVVHAGDRSFPLAERVRAVSIASLLKELEPLS